MSLLCAQSRSAPHDPVSALELPHDSSLEKPLGHCLERRLESSIRHCEPPARRPYQALKRVAIRHLRRSSFSRHRSSQRAPL
jgi:hypothetical protein